MKDKKDSDNYGGGSFIFLMLVVLIVFFGIIASHR